MADDIDRAKDLEMEHRKRSIDHQLAEGRETEGQLIIDSVVCCVDCEEPIPEERLEARPESVRCIDCKSFKEIKEKHHA